MYMMMCTFVGVVLQRLDLVHTVRLIDHRRDIVDVVGLLLVADTKNVLETLQGYDHNLSVLNLQQVAQRLDTTCEQQQPTLAKIKNAK